MAFGLRIMSCTMSYVLQEGDLVAVSWPGMMEEDAPPPLASAECADPAAGELKMGPPPGLPEGEPFSLMPMPEGGPACVMYGFNMEIVTSECLQGKTYRFVI